jgi:hypothetical protein
MLIGDHVRLTWVDALGRRSRPARAKVGRGVAAAVPAL